MKIEITDVKIKKVNDNKTEDAQLLAIATITFNHVFVLTGINIRKGSEGNFVEIPNKERLVKAFKDSDSLILKNFELKLHNMILEEYLKR